MKKSSLAVHVILFCAVWDISEVETPLYLFEELKFTLGYRWMIPVCWCSVFCHLLLIAILGKGPDFWGRLKAIRRGAGQHPKPDRVVKCGDFSSLLWLHSWAWFIQVGVFSAYQNANLYKQAINRLIALPDTPRGCWVFCLFDESEILLFHFWGRCPRELQQLIGKCPDACRVHHLVLNPC